MSRASRRQDRAAQRERAPFADRDSVTVAAWLIAAVALFAGTLLTTRWAHATAIAVAQDGDVELVSPLSIAAAGCWLVVIVAVWWGSLLNRQRPTQPRRATSSRANSRAAQRRQEREAASAENPRFVVRSRVYMRWLYLYVVLWCQVVASLIAAALVLWDLVRGRAPIGVTAGESAIIAGAFVIVAGAWWLLAALVNKKTTALAARHKRVAAQILALAEQRGWTYHHADAADVSALSAPPFSRVVGLSATPSAHVDNGHRIDAAWLAGDFGPQLLPLRSFTSRAVWVRLPRPLQQVDFVPERFADAVIKLLGGVDVDVESYDFNRRWRVKASDVREAHGILQPRMIEFLNSIDDPGVAFHVSGHSVVMWDDGRDEDVDLGARADLLDEFVSRLPGHLRSPEEPDYRSS